jgi:hypothetical protein
VKSISAATAAILASGQYLRFDLYQLTLVTGQTAYFTSGQTSVSVAIYPSNNVNTYETGFTVERGTLTQEVGVDPQDLDLTIAPAWDNPGGAPTVAGYSIMQAARLGLLDNATLSFSKFYGALPAAFAQLDTSPGGVLWFVGVVSDIDVNRFAVKLKISANLILLSQTQMPRNLYQAGCVHTLYDNGCALLQSAFTVSGTVAAVVSSSNFTTNLTKADGYFNLGVLTFTSGANNGYSATVKAYLNTSGSVQLMLPFPATVSVGDQFTVYPGCDKTVPTCINKFDNIDHNKSTPFVPVPETLYDGGTTPGTAVTPIGGQTPIRVGSSISSVVTP